MINVERKSMGQNILFVPLTQDLYDRYIQVGTQAYDEHYLHLWKNQDTSPYLKNSFTIEVLKNEDRDINTELYVIYDGAIVVGILKLVKDSALESYSSQDALLLDKIYLLEAYSGKGIGRMALDFVTSRAQFFKKKVMWLDTMKNGPALKFYQKNGFIIHSEVQHKSPSVLEEQRPMYVMFKLL